MGALLRSWTGASQIGTKKFRCGYCGELVSSNIGYYTQSQPTAHIFICPNCSEPSVFSASKQYPGAIAGNKVEFLPAQLDALYLETRQCVSVQAFTASVLAARKLLMHIAVEQGAKQGETFIAYVDYLATKGYVPPNGKGWVDHIRKKGNEANHEIVLMTQVDAEELISFLEMLLKFIYEFPNRVPGLIPPPAKTP